MAESASLGASLVDVILIEFRETGLQGIQIRWWSTFEEQSFEKRFEATFFGRLGDKNITTILFEV